MLALQTHFILEETNNTHASLNQVPFLQEIQCLRCILSVLPLARTGCLPEYREEFIRAGNSRISDRGATVR
jgi:hypothetical protein